MFINLPNFQPHWCFDRCIQVCLLQFMPQTCNHAAATSNESHPGTIRTIVLANCSGLAAVFQSDIKKLVAYSTTSQLGYICLGCGLGNYSAAVFHLFTHAFFKGLLFLSSGVVIHSIDGVLKTYRLGGLNKLLSIGHGLMVSGSLALVGLPFLAGFYSKELIIICTFSIYL